MSTSQVLFKRSNVASAIPLNTDLAYGELAINTTDLKLYVKLTDDNVYELYSGTSSIALPSGFISQAFPETLSSPDWLVCDGSEYLNSAYPDLAAVALPALSSYTIASGASGNFNKLISDGTNIIASQYATNTLIYKPIATFDPNTSTWSTATIGVSLNTVGVAFNSAINRYCLVTNVGAVYYTDSLATTWTAGGSFSWINHGFTTGVSNGNKQACFVASGTTSAVIKSTTDGRFIGKLGRFPATGNWIDIAHNGTVYCAIMYNSAIAATSVDGITWIQRTLPASANWKLITWNGNVFCAVVENSNVAATSPDGITWTSKTLSQSLNWIGTLEQITLDNRLVFIPTGSTTGIYSTDDGDTWTDFTLPSTACLAIEYIAYSNIYGLGINAHNPNYYTSPDLTTWTNRTYYGVYGVSIINTVVTDEYTTIMHSKYYGGYSYNGITFVSFPVSNLITSSFKLCGYTKSFGGLLTATLVWHNATTQTFKNIAYSTLTYYGISINVNCRDIISRNSKFYTIPSGGSAMMISDDGVSWDRGNLLPASGNWTPPVFNSSGVGVSLCASTTVGVMTTDGEDWSMIYLPVSANWQSVGCTDSFFYAFGYNSNIVIYSFNGLTWYQGTLPATKNWKASGNPASFAFGFSYGTADILYSDNPYNWNYYTNKSIARNWNVGIAVNDSVFLLQYGNVGYGTFSQSTTSFATPSIIENYTGFVSSGSSNSAYIKT